MTFPLRLIVTLAVASAAIAPLAAQAPRSPDSLALAVQERYQQVRDFTAEFVQTLRGGVLRSTESRGEGTVWIKKPGKMRWVYTKPEKQEIVSDGRTMHSYWPEDRQVLKSEVPSDDRAGTSMLFLAGRGDIARDFTAAAADSPLPGTLGLKLTPRQSDPEYQFLVLGLDPTSLQIRALRSRDHQGGDSTLVFSRIKENTNIPDRTFSFTPPRGVIVEEAF